MNDVVRMHLGKVVLFHLNQNRCVNYTQLVWNSLNTQQRYNPEKGYKAATASPCVVSILWKPCTFDAPLTSCGPYYR